MFVYPVLYDALHSVTVPLRDMREKMRRELTTERHIFSYTISRQLRQTTALKCSVVFHETTK